MADAASPPTAAAAAAAPEATGSSTPSAAVAATPLPKPVAPAMPSKTLSWASLAKQNLPPQQPAAPASKAAASSSKATSSKRPSGPSPLGTGKSAGGTSTTKASGGGSKVNGSSQRSTGGGGGAAASAKDLDEHPFTTVTTSRSASSRSVDWRRKDENGAGQPKARRVEKEKGDKPAHRHGEKKAGPAKEGGKTGPSPAKSGPKKADATAASSSTTAAKLIAEETTLTTTTPTTTVETVKTDESSPQEPELASGEPSAAAEPSATVKASAEAAPTAGAPSTMFAGEELETAPEETTSGETAAAATIVPEVPAPPPAPRPVAKPPAVNVWKVRASSAGPATTPAKPPKGFPTASAAAALAKAAKAESIPTPSSSPPASTTSLFTPSNSSATTASPPSTLPATSTTPSLADEAWPEPSMAVTAAAMSSKASPAEGDEAGKAAAATEGVPSKTKKEKKKWVAISPAELQASVDQANAASGKGKKTAKRPTDDAASAASRTAPKKKSVGEGSTTSQPSAASVNGTTGPTKKAKKAAAAALASSQGSSGPASSYPPASLVQHHSPHLDNFQPPPSAYNPHLADMPILPISHLTSAEELLMPQHFDLTAGLPSAGPLSAMDGSLDADNVEISKDVEMSLLKKSGGRASLGGRVEGNGVPVDIAGLLLKDHEATSLGGQAPPHSTSANMDRTRSAPLSGAIPIIAPPSNGLNVQSSVFRPANAGARSPRGSTLSMRGGSSSASASGGRGGSQSGRSPGPNYAGRPNPFAGPYQQASGQPGSHDGRSSYLSPPQSGGSPLGAGGLPSSPHSSFGSYPKDSSMPRLSPRQAAGSFGAFPPLPPLPFGHGPQATTGDSSLGLSSGPSGGNGAPYSAYHAPPPMPLPVTVPAVPLEPLRFYLLGQLEYYFGAHNLVKDFFLRKSMDSLGFVEIPTIAAFNRVKTLTLDLVLVREVLLLSDLVEVREQKVRLANRGWQQWLLPDAPASEFKDDAPASPAAKADGSVDQATTAVAENAPKAVEELAEAKPTSSEPAADAADAPTPSSEAPKADAKSQRS